MPIKTDMTRARTVRKRMSAKGLRPIQYWVPDLRNPRVRAAIRREGALLAKHPENAAIDAWIEAMHDPSEES